MEAAIPSISELGSRPQKMRLANLKRQGTQVTEKMAEVMDQVEEESVVKDVDG